MMRILSRFLIFLGSVTLAMILLTVGLHIYQTTTRGRVPEKTILQVDLGREIVEYAPAHTFPSVLGGREATLLEMVDSLQKAARDPRVAALVARVDASPMGFAGTQELRNAVLAFRKTGKTAVAFAETFGEFGPGNLEYYLATAFDRIYIQPSGDVGLTGFIYESPFLGGVLAKLEVKPRFERRYEYKNALDFLTDSEFSGAHEEAMRKVMDSHFSQLVNAVAGARQYAPEEVKRLIDKGPFSGPEALEARLVDGLLYADQVLDSIRAEVGGDAERLTLAEYQKRTADKRSAGAAVALIHCAGSIQRGKSDFNPLTGSTVSGSDTVAGAFRAAAEDPDVEAILFRVDSPGGSYVASDAIWRAIRQAREAGKPVVASMGDAAGSGGYFVAMAADKIVAHPGTLTGSIGVLAGKLVTGAFWDKLGISWDEIHTSEHAGMWSSIQDYSPAEYARFQQWLDRVYEDFTAKVAQSREMELSQVMEIARGRIWTGEDAKRLGLVDTLGGFPEALAQLNSMLGRAEDRPVTLKPFPYPQSLWSRLLAGSWIKAGGGMSVGLGQAVEPLIELGRSLGLDRGKGVLYAPLPSIR